MMDVPLSPKVQSDDNVLQEQDNNYKGGFPVQANSSSDSSPPNGNTPKATELKMVQTSSVQHTSSLHDKTINDLGAEETALSFQRHERRDLTRTAAATEKSNKGFEIVDCGTGTQASSSSAVDRSDRSSSSSKGPLVERQVSRHTRRFLNMPLKETDEVPTTPPDGNDEKAMFEKNEQDHKKLGEMMATGICGNDITSSCLYVVALATVPAGKYAPIALAFIAFPLYLFRQIYEEVVLALPVNGGTYNLLLNTTSKASAAGAGVLTMLSYVATAVISSSSGMRYVEALFDEGEFPVLAATIALLTVIALLNWAGITESASVALAIFIFHLTTIGSLLVCGAIKAFSNMPSGPGEFSHLSMLEYNWQETNPDGGLARALFFGYASAMLGISGFESSANYVEQQAPGVFPKTLRNMWVCVSFINVCTALLAQCLVPIPDIAAEADHGALLNIMGREAAGKWLEYMIIIDAGTVLSGATLTAFVGFSGLAHRMTIDRCLPQFLLRTNKMRGTRHYIIFSFWLLTCMLVIFTNGNVEIMAGVYTISFLSVMWFFCVGNMLLKLRRARIPTTTRATWLTVIVACGAVTLGLIGNVLSRDENSLHGFLIFTAVFAIPCYVMLNRTTIYKMVASFAQYLLSGTPLQKYSEQTPVSPTSAALDADEASAVIPLPAGERALAASQAHPSTQATSARAGLQISVPGADDMEDETCCGAYRKFVYNRMFKGMWDHVYLLERKPLVFFVSELNPLLMNKAIRYMKHNEIRRWIKFVRVYPRLELVPTEPPAIIKVLIQLYPDFVIEYVAAVGIFGPRLIQRLAYELHIPTSFMFMTAFGDRFPYDFTSLGGLRLITE